MKLYGFSLQEMYYILAVVWGVGQGGLISNMVSTIHSFSGDRHLATLLGLSMLGEGLGGLSLTPLVGK